MTTDSDVTWDDVLAAVLDLREHVTDGLDALDRRLQELERLVEALAGRDQQ